jgi:hypothetical protein
MGKWEKVELRWSPPRPTVLIKINHIYIEDQPTLM